MEVEEEVVLFAPIGSSCAMLALNPSSDCIPSHDPALEFDVPLLPTPTAAKGLDGGKPSGMTNVC
jgi:hypothetical protein